MADTHRNDAKARNQQNDHVYEGLRDPYVLVINNVNFIKNPVPRNGAEFDLKKVETFAKEAGFQAVKQHKDLTKQEMVRILDETRKKRELDKHDGFICIIMSHGDETGILCKHGETIPVEEITAKFRGGNKSCPQLVGKPKLFFIQACRGKFDDKGYGLESDNVVADNAQYEEMPVKLPSEADFLISYSTTVGCISHRRFTDSTVYGERHREKLGSWFISCLVKVLHENSHTDDLMTMLTKVNQEMTKYKTDGGSKQISCHLTMLTRKVYFANFFDKNF
ncbi:Caspase-3 [Stylophora pistillata]|uniref:Caspase-3 n=2 Tax=Stylophora pistillata TaxID=50429 RepID=A0A2B4S6K1_STYPI|nr:Caspase-3 [Stylophora pistillata]